MSGSPEKGGNGRSAARGVPVVICADDYGMNPGIGVAIRELLAKSRLSATSCMTPSSFWPSEGPLLKPLRPQIGVGLHFTLTELKPITKMPDLAADGSLPPLGRLLVRALGRALRYDEIKDELEAQLDRFEDVMGAPPDFLDGHHHVHQLPIIREAVFEVFAKRLAPSGAALRYCDESLWAIYRRGVAPMRAGVISLLSRNFANRARKFGYPGNVGFRGVRNFTSDETAMRLFDVFLRRPTSGMMIMCHPGTAGGGRSPDPMALTRADEYVFLKSDEFATLLAHHGARVA